MMGWQWHKLDHMQVICTLFQTDIHASTSSLKFFIGQMLFLPPNQQHQSTEGGSVTDGFSVVKFDLQFGGQCGVVLLLL